MSPIPTPASRRPRPRLPVLLAGVGAAIAPVAPQPASSATGEPLPNISSEQGQRMVYGPYLCHSVVFGQMANHNAPRFANAVSRALVARLPGGATLCYDVERMAVAALWTGGSLDTSKTHLTSYKGTGPPRPAGPVSYLDLGREGWRAGGEAVVPQLGGYHLHGDEVALSYRVAGRPVIEVPGARPAGKGEGGATAFSRTFEIGAHSQEISLLVARIEGAHVTLAAEGTRAALETGASGGGAVFAVALTGGVGGLRFSYGGTSRGNDLWLTVPARDKANLFTLWLGPGLVKGDIDAFERSAHKAPHPRRPSKMTAGGRARWSQEVVTRGVLGTKGGAYVADELTVPMENPWGAWMRLTGVGFLPGGAMVVSTLSGDVWTVTRGKPEGENDIAELRWRRFATGLYEPLGLEVAGGKVLVRGRDRITRLHDLDGDGEADFYENFHSAGEIGPGYHAFLFDLVQDRAGYFYYSRSGRKAPHDGAVVRVSPDGKEAVDVCGGFRHPNGMGAGGPDDWQLITDNADGKFPAGASVVIPGRSYGYEAPLTAPMTYVLPPAVDSSPGSPCFTDPRRWGPLGGAIVHPSFSKCNLSYVLVQKDTAGHPNGFAVKFPFHLNSGAMRSRVNPADGQLYVAAQKGWDSAAVVDGVVYRVRFTGRPAYVICGAAARDGGVELRFSCDLDPELVEPESFSAKFVGKGDQATEVGAVKLIGPRTVHVALPGLDPARVIDKAARAKNPPGVTNFRVADPLALSVDLEATDGTEIIETIYCTVNSW